MILVALDVRQRLVILVVVMSKSVIVVVALLVIRVVVLVAGHSMVDGMLMVLVRMHVVFVIVGVV